jgi:apolipoprotein N-acyltransferase
MIQRIQTIWLVLAATAAFLTLKFSFYSGNKIGVDQMPKFTSLVATSNIGLLILTIAVGVAALIAVFLYKNRKLQLRITLAAMLLSLLNIVLYYNQTLNFAVGTYDLTALVALAVPVCLLLAAKGIYTDQKLVKSLDRLR